INAAPDEQVVSASAETVGACFVALRELAVSRGLQMRLEATLAQAPEKLEIYEVEAGSRQSLAGKARLVEKALERLGDAIKDAILDCAAGESATPEPLEPLPIMNQERFMDALRERTEQALLRVLQVVNASAVGEIPIGAETQLQAPFAELQREALELGLEMRV